MKMSERLATLSIEELRALCGDPEHRKTAAQNLVAEILAEAPDFEEASAGDVRMVAAFVRDMAADLEERADEVEEPE